MKINAASKMFVCVCTSVRRDQRIFERNVLRNDDDDDMEPEIVVYFYVTRIWGYEWHYNRRVCHRLRKLNLFGIWIFSASYSEKGTLTRGSDRLNLPATGDSFRITHHRDFH